MYRLARILVLAVALLGSIHAGELPAGAVSDSPGECAAIDEASVGKIVDTIHGATIDPVAVGALMEPDVRYVSSTWGVLTSRDEVIAAFTDVAETFDGLSRLPEEVLVDDPYVVVRYVIRGTHVAEYKGIAPTGKDTAASAIAVYRLHCGMIAEGWNFVDQLGRLGQISDDYAAFAVETAPSAELDASCAPPSHEDMETVLREWWADIFVTAPTADPSEMLDPDVVAHFSAGPDAVGLDAWRTSRAKWWAAFPDLRYRHGETIVDGDLAAALFTATGTDEGGFLGEQPSGESMVLDGVLIVRVNCGKVVELWAEADIAGALQQLGTDGLH